MSSEAWYDTFEGVRDNGTNPWSHQAPSVSALPETTLNYEFVKYVDTDGSVYKVDNPGIEPGDIVNVVRTLEGVSLHIDRGAERITQPLVRVADDHD